jgi:hypothetical protein
MKKERILVSCGRIHSWVAALLILPGACCPEPKPAGFGDSVVAGDGSVSSGAARLSVIQTQIFDKSCVTDCHEATNAAADLRLNRGKSHAALVNVASQQVATQVRVVPGDPDRSYLIKKLQGGPGIVGDQMPRLAPPLPQTTIDLVREWITRGAPDD